MLVTTTLRAPRSRSPSTSASAWAPVTERWPVKRSHRNWASVMLGMMTSATAQSLRAWATLASVTPL